MATKKTGATESQDLKAIAADLGVPVKAGKITAVRDRYYVTIGATKKEIAVGEVIDAAQIKALAGKTVSVVAVGRTIVAIGGAGWRPPIIVCYVPAPDIIKEIRPALRNTVLQGLVDRQVITPDLQKRLMSGE